MARPHRILTGFRSHDMSQPYGRSFTLSTSHSAPCRFHAHLRKIPDDCVQCRSNSSALVQTATDATFVRINKTLALVPLETGPAAAGDRGVHPRGCDSPRLAHGDEVQRCRSHIGARSAFDLRTTDMAQTRTWNASPSTVLAATRDDRGLARRRRERSTACVKI